MKRTAIQRKTPLRRTWMRRKPPRRIAKRLADRPFVRFVHTLPCVVASPTCRGRIEANHAGRKPGVGLKAPDTTCVPMCSKHHREWTDHRGVFAGWTREVRADQASAWVAAVQLLATPETYEQALAFAELGLGTVEVEPGSFGKWAWWPAGRREAA